MQDNEIYILQLMLYYYNNYYYIIIFILLFKRFTFCL
jgi:hypothetical protein